MKLEISELLLPAIVIQILQSIKELVCHTSDNKKMYPKTSTGNTRPIAASDSSVAQTRQYRDCLSHYLLVGQGQYRVPNSRTLKILITPQYQPPRFNLRAPLCSAPSN